MRAHVRDGQQRVFARLVSSFRVLYEQRQAHAESFLLVQHPHGGMALARQGLSVLSDDSP